MKNKNPFGKAVFMTLIIIFLTATSPQDALADNGWRTLVGSWLVEITPDQPGPPPFKNLATLNWPGTIVTSDPDLGAGHGAWKRTGKRDFEVKFVVLVRPDNPLGFPPNSTVTVTAFLTVGDSGDEATGTNTGVFADSAGNVIFEITGGVRFTRIKVDDD
jgi:hypothetical protein